MTIEVKTQEKKEMRSCAVRNKGANEGEVEWVEEKCKEEGEYGEGKKHYLREDSAVNFCLSSYKCRIKKNGSLYLTIPMF